MTDRLTRLRALLVEQGLDAFLVSQGENVRYVSGFTGGSDGVLVVTVGQALLATDFRYYEQVRQQAPGWELVEVTGHPAAVLAAQLEGLGANRVGYEKHALTVDTFEQWRGAAAQVEWVGTKGLVEQMRTVKDAGELVLIAEAVRIADEAMAHIYEWLRPGVTERAVAWELESYMRTHGAETLSFTTIVASGPNGAMAHAVTSERPIAEGEPVVIDMGARYEGYCSDITRSFCLGTVTDEYFAAWELVLRAQLAAERAARAGMTGVALDAVARDMIYAAGYEGKFGHGLGHSVGLAIH
ncbi:MAG: aminopeptidase P family protein, partial [Chloroflexi bacterium]|nr:aminopeptidase P family protein [Chloroflexota bacterium]